MFFTCVFQVLEYDKFKQSCLEINKRYMYCLMECFKELVDFEVGKAKSKKKAGGNHLAHGNGTQTGAVFWPL